MAVEKSLFGKGVQGQDVYLYTLSNSKGMKVTVSTMGGIIVNVFVPDKSGNVADVVLGYDKAEDYYVNPCFFGAIIGPSANRIDGATFALDGVTYQLDVNDNTNNLHSHREKGYHMLVWDAVAGDNSVTLTLEDPDGSMGFPGNKKTEVTYSLSENNELKIAYRSNSDKKTILNLTNHTYFNLDGHDSGSIEAHEMWMKAACYTPVVAGAIPTGEIATVTGTPMDFTTSKTVGAEIDMAFEQLELTGGYDHNWVIDGWNGELQHFATVKGPRSGRVMKAYTTLPGVQFYAGNYIELHKGKTGVNYDKRHGLCLETQYYPDSIHHENFPSCVFGGENGEYTSVTVYAFE